MSEKISQMEDGVVTRASDQVPLLREGGNFRARILAEGYTTIRVEKYGDDDTGDGSYGNPFATVHAALAYIEDLDDASATNMYVVKIGPGVFSGATTGILPWVFLEGHTTVGAGNNSQLSGTTTLGCGATRLDFQIGYNAAFETSGYAECGISNIALGDGKILNLSLSAVGGSAGSRTSIRNVFTSNLLNENEGSIRWDGRGRSDVLIADGIRSPAQMHCTDGTAFLNNLVVQGGLSSGHSDGSANTITISNSLIFGVSSLQGNPSNPANCTYVIANTCFVNGFTMSGHGTLSIDNSLPKQSLLTISATPWVITQTRAALPLVLRELVDGDPDAILVKGDLFVKYSRTDAMAIEGYIPAIDGLVLIIINSAGEPIDLEHPTDDIFYDGVDGLVNSLTIGTDETITFASEGGVWVVKSRYSGPISGGNLTVNNLTVEGNAQIDGSLEVGGGPSIAAILKVQGALNFGEIAAGASADLTIAADGAAVNDTVASGLPAAPTAGIIYQMFVSAPDVLTVRATNITGSPIDPASQTFAATIFHYESE